MGRLNCLNTRLIRVTIEKEWHIDTKQKKGLFCILPLSFLTNSKKLLKVFPLWEIPFVLLKHSMIQNSSQVQTPGENCFYGLEKPLECKNTLKMWLSISDWGSNAMMMVCKWYPLGVYIVWQFGESGRLDCIIWLPPPYLGP